MNLSEFQLPPSPVRLGSDGLELDDDACFAAYVTRDRRFDGRFFTGVTTTGIYCRPICPAPAPKRTNVRFFACAAAAVDAGFRACRRCRPEAAPGTPAWMGTCATVSRALRLIDEGALNEGSVESLADRLGVGSRQLRRLFADHLGSSPLSVAKTRRVHFARKLIDETDETVSQIAFAAGFQSIRQFNHDIRQAFGQSPTELRRRARGGNSSDASLPLELKLPYRPPFDWHGLLHELKRTLIPGVESIDAGVYRRAIVVNDDIGLLEVQQKEDRDQLAVGLRLAEPASLIRIVERVRRVFDLSADPLTIAGHLGHDSRLAGLLANALGLRVPGAWSGLEIAVWAATAQYHEAEPTTCAMRALVETFGQLLAEPPSPGITHLFPAPERLARARNMESLGFSPLAATS